MASEALIERHGHAATGQVTNLTAGHGLPALLTKAMILKFYIPAGERTLDRWISAGTFPKADISIGGKTRYWRRETVEAWIETQANQNAGGGR